ncbi:hypothetical protein ABZ894_22010 [Nocardia beijingensis]
MVPLSVLTEELPAISAHLGIEQSAMASLLAVTQPAGGATVSFAGAAVGN